MGVEEVMWIWLPTYRKYDLEDAKVQHPHPSIDNKQVKNSLQQPQHFQPLSHLQNVPPYVNFMKPIASQPTYLHNQYQRRNQQRERPIVQQMNNNSRDNPNDNESSMLKPEVYSQNHIGQTVPNQQFPSFFLPP